jgi:hypothetical protein
MILPSLGIQDSYSFSVASSTPLQWPASRSLHPFRASYAVA